MQVHDADADGTVSTFDDVDESSSDDLHLMPWIVEELQRMTWLRTYQNPRVENEYLVFNVAGKWVLTVFAAVLAIGFLAVAVLVRYFDHPWLGYAHVFVSFSSVVIAASNFWLCIRGVQYEGRKGAIAAAKLHERLGLALMVVCCALPLFQHVYSARCLERKRNYPTKDRDCAGIIFPHTMLLMIAFAVLLRFRPVLVAPPIAAFPLLIGLGRLIEPVGGPFVFWVNIGVHIVVMALAIAFAFILDLQDREKFRDMITLRRNRHIATAARTQLDKTLACTLPKSVLTRLANGEPVVDVAANATISVCEIYDFAQWSTSLLPSSIFQAINALYSAFDENIVRLGIEKLKAVGDQYVCSIGVQEPAFPGDAFRVIQFGLKQLTLVRKLAAVIDCQMHPTLCIGVHTGPVVGAMIGSKWMAYEVFGRTVELARSIALTGGKGMLTVSAASLESGVGAKFDVVPSGAISTQSTADTMQLQASGSATAVPAHSSSSDIQLFTVSRMRTCGGIGSAVIVEVASTVPSSSPNGSCAEQVLIDGASSSGSPAMLDPHPMALRHDPARRGSVGASTARYLHARYKILLGHIKQRHRHHSDTMSFIANFDDLVGRDLAEKMSLNFTKRVSSYIFSSRFVDPDIQAAYRAYLRRVDRDDGTPVMLVLSVFLLSLLVVVVVEAATGTATHNAGGIAVLVIVVALAAARTAYRRFLIVPIWEVAALVATTALAFVAAGLMSQSILSGDFQYLNAIFVPLIAYNCIRLPMLTLTLAILVGSVLPMVIVFVVTQQRVPIELPIIAPLWLFSGLHMAHDRERYHVAHFVHLSLSELHLRCAEDESNLQRDLLNMMFPRHAVSAIIDQCTAPSTHDTIFVQRFSDICVAYLRVDGLVPLFRNVVHETSSAQLLKGIEDIVGVIETAIESSPTLSRIQTLGDTFLIVGPIVADDDSRVGGIDEGKQQEPQQQPLVPPTRTNTLDDPDVGGDQRLVEGEMAVRLQHEAALIEAARQCVDFLTTLHHQLPVEFSAILNAGSAYGAVIGSERVTFDVIGVATRQATALMGAAIPGFCGATPTFKRLLECGRVQLPRHGGDAHFEKPLPWRVRGVGSMSIFPLAWPPSTGSDDGTGSLQSDGSGRPRSAALPAGPSTTSSTEASRSWSGSKHISTVTLSPVF